MHIYKRSEKENSEKKTKNIAKIEISSNIPRSSLFRLMAYFDIEI